MAEVPQSWTACVDGISLEVKPSNQATRKGDGFDRYTLKISVDMPKAIKYLPHSHDLTAINGVDTIFSWLTGCSFVDRARKDNLRELLHQFAVYFGFDERAGAATFWDQVELSALPPRPKGWPGC